MTSKRGFLKNLIGEEEKNSHPAASRREGLLL